MDPETWDLGMGELRAHFDEMHPFEYGRAIFEGDIVVELKVATTLEQRARGLIGATLEPGRGMLFVQPRPLRAQYHGAGVTMDLVLLSYDEAFKLVDRGRIVAGSHERVSTPATARYQLELELGYFESELLEAKLLDLSWGNELRAQLALPDAHTREAANYRKGEGEVVCGNCRHHVPPDGCRIVLGDIESDGVCDYFASRT